MSFRKNDSRMLDFDEIAIETTKEELEFIPKTWAGDFRTIIFDKINENPYAVLFSEKDNSRQNVPINVIIGLLILKELFAQTDEEAIASGLFDSRYKYALRTAELKNQITNVSVLTRFRKKVVAHLEETKEDLIKNTFQELAGGIAKFMGITGTKKRIDSMMIAANIKKLGRLELLYECIADAVGEIEKRGGEIPEKLKHYTEKSDRNREFYHKKEFETYEEHEDGSLVSDYDVQKNTYSDKQFLKDTDVYADFELAEDDKKVLKCPFGHEPEKCYFSEKTGEITAYFNRKKCEGCPFRNKCHAKIGKKNAQVKVSRAKKERALSRRFMKSDKGAGYVS